MSLIGSEFSIVFFRIRQEMLAKQETEKELLLKEHEELLNEMYNRLSKDLVSKFSFSVKN